MSYEKHYMCIACSHVFKNTRPVLLIARDIGYPPQFMCGESDHYGPEDGKVVGYSHLLGNDPTLEKFENILEGYEYERVEVGKQWIRKVIS